MIYLVTLQPVFAKFHFSINYCFLGSLLPFIAKTADSSLFILKCEYLSFFFLSYVSLLSPHIHLADRHTDDCISVIPGHFFSLVSRPWYV